MNDPFSSYWFYILLLVLSLHKGWKIAISSFFAGSLTFILCRIIQSSLTNLSTYWETFPSIAVAMSIAMIPWILFETKNKKIPSLFGCTITILIIIFHRVRFGEHSLIDVIGGLFIGFIVLIIINKIRHKIWFIPPTDEVDDMWPNSSYVPSPSNFKWSRAEVAERYPDVSSPLFVDYFLSTLSRSVTKMGRILKIAKPSLTIGYCTKGGFIYSNMGPQSLNLFKVLRLFLNIRSLFLKYINQEYPKIKSDFVNQYNDTKKHIQTSSTLQEAYVGLNSAVELFDFWMFHQSVSLFYSTFSLIYLRLILLIHFPVRKSEIFAKLSKGLKTPTYEENCLLFELGKLLNRQEYTFENLPIEAKNLVDKLFTLVFDRFPSYDFVQKSWRDAPDQILDLAKAVASAPTSPQEQHTTVSKEREYTESQLEKRVRLLHPFSGKKLANDIISIFHSSIPFKEERQKQMAASWSLVKMAAKVVGKYLVGLDVIKKPDDIFFLLASEISMIVRAKDKSINHPYIKYISDTPSLIVLRKNQFEYLTKSSLELEMEREAVLEIQFLDKLKKIFSIRRKLEKKLQGKHTLPGVIEGKAVVIRNMSEFSKMEQGAILVAKTTNPHWDILFPLAGGIITETGSPASHAGIKATEYGLPAILGVSNATRKIKDGDLIRLDGNKNKITKITSESHE